MTPPTPPRPILILGPTAGGKSELAVALALRLPRGGQIISADSMQIYRHLDAGTAKPSARLRALAPHHLIDIVEPTEPFTVAHWLARAEQLIADLQRQGIHPIVVGGTNLYIKALLEGLFDGPSHDPTFRATLTDLSSPQLHEQLAQVDPPAAQRIHRNDRKRLIRALEVFHLTGQPISTIQTQWLDAPAAPSAAGDALPPTTPNAAPHAQPYRFNPILLGLAWPPDAINPRINLRVKAMFFPETVDPTLAADVCPNNESLPHETARLHAAGLLGPQAREALGYKQVLQHLTGEITFEQAYEKTKILTRRFAKQQRTWLRRFHGVTWLDPIQLNGDQTAAAATNAILEAR
jgi:tRNA dimethylallyltransferase